MFEKAGLLKFDEPRSVLAEKLVGLCVSLSFYSSNGRIGNLDGSGARQVVDRIEQLGFKITR
jgi:hypothetical protein